MSASPLPRRAVPRIAWIGLAALLLFDAWLRGHVVGPDIQAWLGFAPYPVVGASATPLDCDEAIYGYIGDRLARGEVMYRDLTENKPPGGYWLYALFVGVFGMREATVRLMPIPLVAANLALVWWLGHRLRGPVAAFSAAFVFALVSTDPYLYGDGCQMEAPLNLFATAALACAIEGLERGHWRWWLLAGLTLGLALLVKQVAILYAPLLLFALARRPASGEESPGRRFPAAAALLFGLAIPLVLSATVLIWSGAGQQAYEDVFRYGGALASDTPAPPNAPHWSWRWLTGNADPQGALPWPFGSTNYLAWWGTGSWPFWLLSTAALAWLTIGPGANFTRRLLAGWVFLAWLQVALPGLYWAHYYLLPIPGLCVAVGVLLGDLIRDGERKPTSELGRALGATVVMLAIAGTAYLRARDYLLVPSERLVDVKGGPQWLANRELGREIARRTAAWNRPTLFVWGWQGTLYFYSGLDHVTPQVFVDDLMRAFAGSGHPRIRPRVERTMRDLRRDPPSLMFVAYPPFPALQEFMEERYLPSRVMGLWVEKSRYGDFEANVPPSSPR